MTTMPFDTVRRIENLPKGPGGCRGIQFKRTHNHIVLLVGNRSKYTDIVENPSEQIGVSGEKGRASKDQAFIRGNKRLQKAGDMQTTITVYNKLGVNLWQHVGMFRLQSSAMRCDMGPGDVCWFELRNVVGDFVARARVTRRLLVQPAMRRSARLLRWRKSETCRKSERLRKQRLAVA